MYIQIGVSSLILTSACLNLNANEFLENRGILAVTIVILIQRLADSFTVFCSFIQFALKALIYFYFLYFFLLNMPAADE